MKFKWLIFLIAFSLFPTSNVSSADDNISITVSSDGKAKIKQVLDISTTVSNVKIRAISDNISSVLATDEKGILLHTTNTGDIIQIATLGASEVNLSYEAKIASKRGDIWRLSYETDKQSILTLPDLSKIISVNTIPSNIDDRTLTMKPGDISISYTIQDVSENTFLALVEGNDYSIQVVTASKVSDFDNFFSKFRFNIDERAPILVILPNSYISDPIDVSLSDNRVDFQKLSHNSTHSWIRINPHDKGTIEIAGGLQQQGVHEIKISGDMDLYIGLGIGAGMLMAVLALKSKVRNGKKMRQKSEIYQEIQRRRKRLGL